MLPSLEHVVQIHSKLSYRDFYAFLGRVDVVLPAFTEQGNVSFSLSWIRGFFLLDAHLLTLASPTDIVFSDSTWSHRLRAR